MRPISDRDRAFPGGARRAPRSDAGVTVPDPPLGGPRGEARSRRGRRGRRWKSADGGGAGVAAAGSGARTIRR